MTFQNTICLNIDPTFDEETFGFNQRSPNSQGQKDLENSGHTRQQNLESTIKEMNEGIHYTLQHILDTSLFCLLNIVNILMNHIGIQLQIYISVKQDLTL